MLVARRNAERRRRESPVQHLLARLLTEEVHAAVGDEVGFLGFALQDTAAAAQVLIDETGVTYDWALDPDGAIFAGFGGFAMPTTVYVSADGEILERDNGAIDASTLHERIEWLFGVTAR